MNDFKDSWKDYCTSAWLSMGMPIGLSPRDAIENPEQYDQSYYEYFERRYMDMWMAVYSNVNPVNGNLLKPESPTFRSFWKRYFSWDTIWKQLLPLFVYGTSLGVKNAILIELASYYCLGQAIPSVVIDKMLDDSLTVCSYDFSPFCMSAYGKAISGIRSLDISCGSEIENAYIAYTCEMYDRMLMENNQRFGPFPEHVSDSIRNYFDQKSSRLLSSIFFGVLLEWACLLSEKVRPNELSDSSKKLRQVRQLNDEILDVYSDIRTGLLTLPWLYAIEEFPELQSSIQQLWREKGNTASFGQCQDMMRRSQARQRAAERSRELLGQSMTRTQQLFKAEIAFDITLLHNWLFHTTT
jgi:hypothetical protein